MRNSGAFKMTDILFTPARLGAVQIANRVVMAPMTRNRAGNEDVPTETMVEYYRQRSGAGLIVTEGTQPSREGKGYWRTPGIHSPAQVAGWRKVTDAVHAEGGKIAVQLMHCGRAVVPANREYDADIIAPSAIPLDGGVPGPDGKPLPTGQPREMDLGDMERVTFEYADAARNASMAGFDAVELHCASGYLINQFLNPGSNRRTDEYGGNGEARARFPAQIVDALANAIGADRVGIRISPGNPYNGMDPSDPAETFVPFLKAIADLPLAYVHVVDLGLDDLDALAMVRDHFTGAIIANNMLEAESGAALIDAGRADAVSFGRHWIGNPDLVERLRAGAALTRADRTGYYSGEERGYTDYPTMDAT